MYILGVNWEQNSTASLFHKEKLLGCVSEERFSRVKNDERYPFNAINWLLEANNITSENIQKVIFVSKTWSPGYVLTRHYTNFSVKDYIYEDALRMLLESERIKSVIRDYEQDMWNN